MIEEFIIYLFVVLIGLAVGSFLNCLIYRMSVDEKPTGKSYCPKCKNELGVRDLIPLFSYFFLKGRCRYCRESISLQYPLVEFFTGLTFFLVVYHLKIPNYLFQVIEVLLVLSIFSLLIFIFVYDLKHYIIPNKIIYPAIFLALILTLLRFLNAGDLMILVNHLLTGIFFFLFFLSIYLLTQRKGIGFGDVRYALFFGIFLGAPAGLVGMFSSFVIGAIIGIALMILKKKGRKDMIPFGPFLVFGTYFGFFMGEIVINFYLGLII